MDWREVCEPRVASALSHCWIPHEGWLTLAFVPLYMDRHDVPGATAEEIAAAHLQDVGVQSAHGVRFLTYWFETDSASVFCLAEGPSIEAVEQVHRESHGQIPGNVIEVEPGPVQAFFGSLPEHPVGESYAASAVRAVLFTDICGSTEMTERLGDDRAIALLHEHDGIVRDALAMHDGREVKHTGDGIMASFNSVSGAVDAAIAMQRRLADREVRPGAELDVRIGISAGEPVSDHDDLFGAAVQLAARLCSYSTPRGITVSVAVRELCVGKQFRFEPRGPVTLKGFSEPTQVYEVHW
jgi:class 3 adenylate cyclase